MLAAPQMAMVTVDVALAVRRGVTTIRWSKPRRFGQVDRNRLWLLCRDGPPSRVQPHRRAL